MEYFSSSTQTIYTFEANQLIPLPEECFWLVKEGIVKTFTSNELGSEISLGYWGSGDIIGKNLCLIEFYQIQCLTKVRVIQFPYQSSSSLLELIRHHIQETEELLYILRSEKINQKLQGYLVWLGKKFGTKVREGIFIDFPLTHQELGEAIGATRVTITKIINQLERDNFLVRPGRSSIILRS